MNIVWDVSQMAYTQSGVGRYTRGLLEAILKYEREHTWHFLYYSWSIPFPRDLKQNIQEKGFLLTEWKVPNTAISWLWNSVHILPVDAFFKGADWFISSDWVEPPARTIQKATVVHDMIYKLYPEVVHPTIIKQQNRRFAHIERETKVIFADSHATKADIERLLPGIKAPIETVYIGVNPLPYNAQKKDTVLKKFGIHKPFFLSVGTLSPRKNIQTLIDAFYGLPQKEAYSLVVVGNKGWGETPQNPQDVVFTGGVTDEELGVLYANCFAFVFPSLYEGFGIPLIEAMHAGAPCACSATSSLKELAGNNALTFNPTSTQDMQRALTTLVTDKNLYNELKKKGPAYAKSFTWQKTHADIIRILKTYGNRN